MTIDPTVHLRLARPTRDLSAAHRFWCDGLGLSELYRAEPSADGEHALLMVGWPEASWHLELVADEGAAARARPSEEDLLVLYLGDDAAVRAGIKRLEAAGGRPVVARNPYWDTWGRTVEDPDGYRLVLCRRLWT